jgi:hypothetical protein
MDHASEQQMELEALEAIFMEDLKEYNGTLPSDWAAVGKTYIHTVTPHDEGDEEAAADGQELQMELLWAHTAQYPEELPCLKLQAVYGLTDAQVASCAAQLQEEASQNLGMAMMYTLITAAKEWLRGMRGQKHRCVWLPTHVWNKATTRSTRRVVLLWQICAQFRATRKLLLI